MVEAGDGVGIVPSFVLPVCRYRKVVVTRLVNPTVDIDFYQIRNRELSSPKLRTTLHRFSRDTLHGGQVA